jgi:hypothetical protein
MPAHEHLSPEEFAATKAAHDQHQYWVGGEYCYDIAERVEEATGFQAQAGTYMGKEPNWPDLPAMSSNHGWNVTPSGVIVDAAADFYGHETPRIVGPEHPDYPNYQPNPRR